jgi:hypothetical protein
VCIPFHLGVINLGRRGRRHLRVGGGTATLACIPFHLSVVNLRGRPLGRTTRYILTQVGDFESNLLLRFHAGRLLHDDNVGDRPLG